MDIRTAASQVRIIGQNYDTAVSDFLLNVLPFDIFWIMLGVSNLTFERYFVRFVATSLVVIQPHFVLNEYKEYRWAELPLMVSIRQGCRRRCVRNCMPLYHLSAKQVFLQSKLNEDIYFKLLPTCGEYDYPQKVTL